jgi:hypothetical protein
MRDAGLSAEQPLLEPPPSLLKLTTQELTADEAAASSRAAGLAKLRQPGVASALRSALHMVGAIDQPLSSEHKSALAERYIHIRIAVDAHTASALLFESFSQSRVFILRNFPGATPPAIPTVTALLRHPPCMDTCPYSFNHHGSRVHFIFMTRMGDSAAEQAAAAWWHRVNLLPDVGLTHDHSNGCQWNFVSRRAKSSLHVDSADGTSTQWLGKKRCWRRLAKLSGTVSLLFSQTPCATTQLVSTACQPGWPATRSSGVYWTRGTLSSLPGTGCTRCAALVMWTLSVLVSTAGCRALLLCSGACSTSRSRASAKLLLPLR